MKWIAKLLGREVVYLRDFDGEIVRRLAWRNPFGLFCYRHKQHGLCLLRDDGTVCGPSYVSDWKAAP